MNGTNSVLIKAYDHGCDGRATGQLMGHYWIPAELSAAFGEDGWSWTARRDVVEYVKNVYGDDIGWYSLYLVPISERTELIAQWKSKMERLAQLLTESGHE